MAIPRQRHATRQLRTLYQLGAIGDLSDRELLERFTASEGELAELAFTVLVERHGPMVLRVCAALLRNPHDAQDAFQATFLVLLRKARELWIHDSLGPWLHRVSKRLAVQIRATARRRQAFERRAAESKAALIGETIGHDGRSTVLHEEIDRLPERYRAPVILCHLEGQSLELTARSLKLPVGTIKSRLHRARDILRGRLARRGAAFSAALISAEMAFGVVEASFNSRLSLSLFRAVARSGVNRASEKGLISLRSIQLVEEVFKTMFVTRVRIGVAVALLAGCLAVAAVGVFAQSGTGQETGREPNPSSSDTTRAAAGPELAPPYIRQSRRMIVERLEQELAAARERVDRTTRKVKSSTDPELVRARKTADTLAGLMARIDAVLVEAVDRFPTMFDFTNADATPTSALKPLDQSPKAPPLAPPQNDANVNRSFDVLQRDRAETQLATPRASAVKRPEDASAGPAYDEHSLARAAEKLEWSRKMLEKGYVSKSQHDRDRLLYESLKARIEADIARAQDRAEWARRMHEKGYVSKSQFDAEILKHYGALKARMEAPAVSDAVLNQYDDLKRQYETKPKDPNQTSKPSTLPEKPADASPPKQ